MFQLLSECLTFVAMTESTQVTLPVDPLVHLTRRWDLANLDIYEELWQVKSVEALAYLRQQIKPALRREGRAEQVWGRNTDGVHFTSHFCSHTEFEN